MKPSSTSRPRLNALPSYCNTTKDGELQRRRHSYHLNALQQNQQESSSANAEAATTTTTHSSSTFSRPQLQYPTLAQRHASSTAHYPPLTKDRLEKKNKLDLLLSGKPTAGVRRLARRQSISNGYFFRHLYNEDDKPMKWLDQLENTNQRQFGSTDTDASLQNSLPSSSKLPSEVYDKSSKQTLSTQQAQGQRSPSAEALSADYSIIQPVLTVYSHPKSPPVASTDHPITERSARSSRSIFLDQEPPRRLSKLLAMAAAQREQFAQLQQEQQQQQQNLPCLAAARKTSSNTEQTMWQRAFSAMCSAADRIVDARSCETASTRMGVEDVTSLARYVHAFRSRKSFIGNENHHQKLRQQGLLSERERISESCRRRRSSYAPARSSQRSSTQNSPKQPVMLPDHFDLLAQEEEEEEGEEEQEHILSSAARALSFRRHRQPPSTPPSEGGISKTTDHNTKVSRSFPDDELYTPPSPPSPAPPEQESNHGAAAAAARKRLERPRFSSAKNIFRSASIPHLFRHHRRRREPSKAAERGEQASKETTHHPIFASIDPGPGIPISFEGWSLNYFGPTSELRFKLWKYIASR